MALYVCGTAPCPSRFSALPHDAGSGGGTHLGIDTAGNGVFTTFAVLDGYTGFDLATDLVLI